MKKLFLLSLVLSNFIFANSISFSAEMSQTTFLIHCSVHMPGDCDMPVASFSSTFDSVSFEISVSTRFEY